MANEEAALNQAEVWNELVLSEFPNATEEERHFILWEKTSFPFGTRDEVAQHIREYAAAEKSN